MTLNIYEKKKHLIYISDTFCSPALQSVTLCIVKHKKNNVKYNFYSVIKNLERVFWCFFAAIIGSKGKLFDKFLCLSVF